MGIQAKHLHQSGHQSKDPEQILSRPLLVNAIESFYKYSEVNQGMNRARRTDEDVGCWDRE